MDICCLWKVGKWDTIKLWQDNWLLSNNTPSNLQTLLSDNIDTMETEDLLVMDKLNNDMVLKATMV